MNTPKPLRSTMDINREEKIRIKPALTDVPETMLWTLHNRATEAQRTDSIINDPKAIEIFHAIDYDYRASFGHPNPVHAKRSCVFDQAIRAFCKEQKQDIVIINLGEGLETQRFRLSDISARWFSIDLPQALAIRERFMTPDDRHHHIALSALDRDWFKRIPKDHPQFISAQGLLMYFEPDDVKQLLQDIQIAFPASMMMFDTIPRWMSRKTLSPKGMRISKTYVAPQMPWGINTDEFSSVMHSWLGHNVVITKVVYGLMPRGILKWIYGAVSLAPWFRNRIPSIMTIRFQPQM